MTTNNIPTAEELTAELTEARNARLVRTARNLLAELRSGDRLISKDNTEKASPKRMRPSVKTGKKIRRDASFNLADDLIDLEKALDRSDYTEVRQLVYRIRRTTQA